MIPIVDQRPMRGAFIAQPKMFHLTLLLPGSDKRRSRRLTGFRKAIRFYQEKLAFPQPEKRLLTSRIGAMTEHGDNCFLLSATGFEERSNSFLIARLVPSFNELR